MAVEDVMLESNNIN